MRESRPGPAADAASPRPPLVLLVAVFAVAMSVLGFEVALTRAFSVLLRFHYVFLAISLATCGLGLGGLADFLLRRGGLRDASPGPVLVVCGTLCALLMPLTFYLLFATALSAHLTSVWVVTAACLPPFLAAGAFLSHAFAWHSGQGGRLYFADLFGASLGSFLVIAALQLLGGINAGMIWGAVVAVGATALAVGLSRRMTPLPALTALAVMALVFANRGGALVGLPILPLTEDPNAKPLFRELGDPAVGAKIVATRWNAFARTDVVSNAGQDDLFVYTDGEVPTNLIRFDGDLQKLLPRLRTFIGWFAFEQSRPKSTLLIGPGGGLDILLALAVDAQRIDGVELSPSIPELVREYSDFTGHVYDIEGVNVRVDEGRSFINRSRDRYDLIYSALTKTATTASSSLALVESYIYTIEAFEGYLDHLSDRGMLGFVCQSDLVLLRAMLTAVQAIQNRGVPRQEALRHICLLSVSPTAASAGGPYRYLMLMGRQAFSPSRSRQLATRCIAGGFEPVFFPGAFEPVPFTWLTKEGLGDTEFIARWNEAQGLSGAQRMDFSPCPDDRPFVVDMGVGIPRQFTRFLEFTLAVVVLLTVCAMAWVRLQPTGALPGPGRLAGAALYFCLLGVGFMLVEVVLAQRLVLYLGYPVLTLSVILFSLLLGGGLGSLYSQRWEAGRGLALRAGAAALVAAAGAVAIHSVHPLIVQATLAWDIRLRCAVAMVLLAPIGFVMGMPFPAGIRIVGAWAADLVPWMWGLNGVTSVVGSVGAMCLARQAGFRADLAAGALLYLLAAATAFGEFMLTRDRSHAGGRQEKRGAPVN